MSQTYVGAQVECPGSRTIAFSDSVPDALQGTRPSQLRQWPIQLCLVSPMAPYFRNADVLLVADCVAYAVGDFHKDYLTEHSLAIACPKLDTEQDLYREKLVALVDEAEINSLTVMIMQVPCCARLLRLAESAREQTTRKMPIQVKVVSLQGEILAQEWA